MPHARRAPPATRGYVELVAGNLDAARQCFTRSAAGFRELAIPWGPDCADWVWPRSRFGPATPERRAAAYTAGRRASIDSLLDDIDRVLASA